MLYQTTTKEKAARKIRMILLSVTQIPVIVQKHPKENNILGFFHVRTSKNMKPHVRGFGKKKTTNDPLNNFDCFSDQNAPRLLEFAKYDRFAKPTLFKTLFCKFMLLFPPLPQGILSLSLRFSSIPLRFSLLWNLPHFSYFLLPSLLLLLS